MHRLLALTVATTVAKEAPTSGNTGENEINHNVYPVGAAQTNHRRWQITGANHSLFSTILSRVNIADNVTLVNRACRASHVPCQGAVRVSPGPKKYGRAQA